MSITKEHIAERTCIACRQIKPKRDLVRLVRTPEGEVQVDEQGKKTGRGTYLCKRSECWEIALAGGKKDRLSHSLKVPVSQQNRSVLSEYGKTLPSKMTTGERGI